MECGFDTIGNATVIVYDKDPILVTDPWVLDSAYFGSWSLSHEIPPEQMDAIRRARFAWISHGHPDHLSGKSLTLFKEKQILLPDHVGGRIATALRQNGYMVTVLPDNQWISLSDRVRVRCRANKNQDGILLIDVNGRLILDFNDATERPSGKLRKLIKSYPRSFLLRLNGFGDADMINFHDEQGNQIPPVAKKWKDEQYPLGEAIAKSAEAFGVTNVIPFSSMHRYQRSDSVWANVCRADAEDHTRGFESERCESLPAFVRFDCLRDECETIDPAPVPEVVIDPIEFGDDWDVELGPDDIKSVTAYFQRIEHLSEHLDYVNIRVGGRDHNVPLAGRGRDRAITFEAPRTSLMKAIQWNIFDDLLIGNFMKTTLHGSWPTTGLYPDFTPYVTKYADNGEARSNAELKAYFAEYRRRMAPWDFLRSELESRAVHVFRNRISQDSLPYTAVRRAYWFISGATGPPPTASRPRAPVSQDR